MSPDRDRFWIGTCLSLAALGATLLLAAHGGRHPELIWWLGIGTLLSAAYVLLAMFVTVPLPLLRSERDAHRVQKRRNEFVERAHGLEARKIADEDEFESLLSDYREWQKGVLTWLNADLSRVDALRVKNVNFNAAEVFGSLNQPHNNLRLRIRAQIAALEQVQLPQ